MRTQIQTSIIGYGGDRVTVYSLLTDAGILAVSKEGKYRADRFGQCVIVSNEPMAPRDYLFTEEMLQDAVGAYQALLSSGLLQFDDKVQRVNPMSVIEQDGIDEKGRRYRFSADVMCGHVAVLATCLYVQRQGTIKQMESFADRLDALENMGIRPADAFRADEVVDVETFRRGHIISV